MAVALALTTQQLPARPQRKGGHSVYVLSGHELAAADGRHGGGGGGTNRLLARRRAYLTRLTRRALTRAVLSPVGGEAALGAMGVLPV